jgi:hypothetical protein
MMVLENRVLRKITWPEGVEVTQAGKTANEKLHDLYPSQNPMRWAGNGMHSGEEKRVEGIG